MLIAHLDTVQPGRRAGHATVPAGWQQTLRPRDCRRQGWRRSHPALLALLKELGWRDHAQITVLFNPDEEIGSRLRRADRHPGGSPRCGAFLRADRRQAVAQEEGVLLGAAGAGTATLEVRGRGRTLALPPNRGRNALIELAHQMLATEHVAKEVPVPSSTGTYAGRPDSQTRFPRRPCDCRRTTAQPGGGRKLETP